MGCIAGQARHLMLPGSGMATITPVFVLFLYLFGVVLENLRRRPRLSRVIIPALIVFFMYYPVIIYRGFSHNIKTPGALSSDDFERFKSEFGVPVVWDHRPAASIISVAARDFRPEMVSRLQEMASKSGH